MNQITVRGIAPDLEKQIRRRAKATGKSLNKVMLELIGESAGPEKRGKKPAGASLAELAGGWSEKEAREFEESVRVFEEIDQATWK
jgi:plasmid stability protein